MMVIFQGKRLHLKNQDYLQLLVKKFSIHNLNPPYERGILELKDNYAHVIHDPVKRNQGVV